MKLSILLIVALLGAATAQVQLAIEAAEALDIITLVLDIADYISSIWTEGFLLPRDLNIHPDWKFFDGSYNLSLDVSGSKEIMEHFGRLSQKIDEVESALTGIGRNLRELQDALPAIIRYEVRLDRLLSYVHPIDTLYSTMQRYRQHEHSIENHTLLNFAESTVSHTPGSVQSIMGLLHGMVLPWMTGEQGLFDHIHTLAMSNEHRCSMQHSPQQLAYGVLQLLLITQVKGFAMMEFSWLLLRSYKKGNFKKEALLAKENYEAMVRQEITLANATISKAATDYWKCDPEFFSENHNFIALKRLLQGYVENEVDMHRTGSCTSTCDRFELAKQKRCYKNKKYHLCRKQSKCEGDIRDCRYYDSDMDICFAADSDRRYAWIRYENGRMLGSRKEPCKSRKKVDSWWRAFVHCSFCFCICDDVGGETERYFDLRALTANTTMNKIVTGMRFQKTNRLVHLEIQTGVALPGGEIKQSTVEWVKPEVISLYDPNIKEGKDYFKMTWAERGVDLDEMKVPKGHVLTGVQMRVVGGHIGLMVQSMPINFKTGILDTARLQWTSNDNTAVSDHSRTLMSLKDPDVPTRSPFPSWPKSEHNEYLHFTHSSISKDAAQTTVPYIDSQPVAPSPAVWLTGVGFYYKGTEGYGGFLGIKVWTFEVSSYMILPTKETLEVNEEKPEVATEKGSWRNAIDSRNEIIETHEGPNDGTDFGYELLEKL